MSFTATISPGPYIAGLSRPFFVSRGMVESRAKTEGFGPLTWFSRDTDSPMVNPKHDPKYSDDWDEWVSATYQGQPRTMRLPASPAWLLRNDKVGTPETTTSTAAPWVAPAVTVGAGVALIGIGKLLDMWWGE